MPAVTGVILANAPGDDLAHDLCGRSRHTLPVGGIPLVARARTALARAGCGSVLVAVSAATAPDVAATLGEGTDLVEVDPATGPGGVLAAAGRRLAGDVVVLHAGDAFAGPGAVAAAVRLGGDGVLAGPGGLPPPAVVLGAGTAGAAPGAPDLAGLVAALRAGGHEVADRPAGAAWRYGGTGDSLLEGNRLALESLESVPTDADVSRARIEGRVVVHPTAVLDRVHIRGPAWIGPRAVLVDAFIGPYTSVGDSVRVEGAEVEHALLLPGAWIRHLDRRLESSVIGRDARIVREFSVPANVRLRVGRGAEVALS
jgi:glucose-1-phosphate thymidylyltransferase